MKYRSRNQLWLYLLALLGVVVAAIVLTRLLTAGFQAYLALITGVLLLVGNSTEIVQSIRQRTSGVALLNLFVALALIVYFVGGVLLPLLFWPLSILLLLLALPLATRRAAVVRAYARTTRTLFNQLLSLWRSRQRTM